MFSGKRLARLWPKRSSASNAAADTQQVQCIFYVIRVFSYLILLDYLRRAILWLVVFVG